jgi:hypothetical protein
VNINNSHPLSSLAANKDKVPSLFPTLLALSVLAQGLTRLTTNFSGLIHISRFQLRMGILEVSKAESICR